MRLRRSMFKFKNLGLSTPEGRMNRTNFRACKEIGVSALCRGEIVCPGVARKPLPKLLVGF
jgi:hypothetical protein